MTAIDTVHQPATCAGQASALGCLPPISALKGPESAASALRATGTNGPEKVPTVVRSGAENGAIRLASEASDPAPDCTEKESVTEETKARKTAKNPTKSGVFRTRPHQLASHCKAEREGYERRLFPTA
jgi:hypothetical protein